MTGVAHKQNALLRLFSPGVSMTVDRLDEYSELSRHEVVRTAGRLIERSYLDRLETGVFILTDEGENALANDVEIRSGPKHADLAIARPPRQSTLRASAWAAMRVMNSFSTEEIVAVIKDDPTNQDQDNITRYCRALNQAGILVLMPTRGRKNSTTSNGFKRYRILNDVGDIAPTHRVRSNDVFDHNSRAALPCQ